MEIGGTGPYYVVRKDFENNTLYVTNKADDPNLSAKSLIAENVNWISGIAPKFPFKCQAVIRYRHLAVPCTVCHCEPKAKQSRCSAEKLRDCRASLRSARNDKLVVEFSTPQRAITPGQSVVFYKGDELLGGGVIQL